MTQAVATKQGLVSKKVVANAKEHTPAGGVTLAKGFMAAGAHVGVKKSKKDLALIWSTVPAKAAAVFTTNVVKAAPLLWNQKAMSSHKLMRGIVINSGNANACTGAEGMVNAEAMACTFAQCMAVEPEEILIASTGVIGVQLPIERIEKGIAHTFEHLNKSNEAGTAAAEAIMTTDTFAKQAAVLFTIGGKKVVIGGMAKGSGMIHPNMATMLSFLTTDVNISSQLLQKALKESTEETYNMISVDGDTSTNDMVAILANGMACNACIDKEGKDYLSFCAALKEVNTQLAKSIVADGEGATKFLEVEIHGAATIKEARQLARSVVSSSLVKAAFFGEDANWGRIICAMGYSGVKFEPNHVSIALESTGGKVALMKAGEPLCFNEILAKKVLAAGQIKILVDMKEGKCQATAWGCDLSYDYVRINGAYRT